MIIGEARKNSLAAVCAVAREQGVPVNGGDRKNQHNNRNTDTRQGNDPVYLARRILGADPTKTAGTKKPRLSRAGFGPDGYQPAQATSACRIASSAVTSSRSRIAASAA